MGNIELFELLETDPKTQCKACLSYWNIGIVYCTCGHFLHKETAVNRKFVNCTMDLLSIPEYVIKKGRPHGHRYGKKPGDKEYYLANQLKKKCKKKKFQGIHDRFLLDHAFRVRMIESNRDEEACRRWDVPGDEDHTYHLSEEEYFYYKNKWWLHLNKSGSDTCHCENVLISSKRCLPQNVYTKKLERHNSRSLLTGRTNNGSRHRVRPLHGGNGKTPGDLLKIQKVKEEANKVLGKNLETRCFTVAKTSEDGFQDFNLFCYR